MVLMLCWWWWRLYEQYWMDGKIKVDSAGYPSYYDAAAKCYAAAGRCRPYLRSFRRVLSANWMSLCCGIGNYVWKLQEVGRLPTQA